MEATEKVQTPRLDRRLQALLDAQIVQCAQNVDKHSFRLLVEKFRRKGITISFKQLRRSVQSLEYRWKDVFLPATRAERGHPDAKRPVSAELAAGNADKHLRQISVAITELSSAIGELRLSQHAIQQHIATERQLAKDRVAAYHANMQTLTNQIAAMHTKADGILRLTNLIRLTQKHEAVSITSELETTKHTEA